MARKSKNEVNWFDMEEIPYRTSRLMRTLGNPKAYALVRLLLDEDVLSVEEIATRLDRAPWTVSKILRPLRDLDLVRYQRDGRGTLYTLKDAKRLGAFLKSGEDFVRAASGAR